MKDARKTKIAMMAGASLIAAAGALAPVHAANVDPAAYPAVISGPANVSHAADHAEQPAQHGPKRWILIAIAAGALAGLAKLIGPRKIVAAASQGAAVAAKAVVVTIKAADKALGSPLRNLMLFAGLLSVAFLGVGVFDVEWTAGLIIGAMVAASAYFMVFRLRRALVPARSKEIVNDVRVNGDLPRKSID